MNFEFDMHEFERQRYNYIKKTGNYIEVDILVGTETNEFEGHTGRMPVINTKMMNCGPEEVACMYAALKALVSEFEENYPIECCLSDLMMGVKDLGSSSYEPKEDKDDEDKTI